MKRPTNAVLAAIIVLSFAQYTVIAAHGAPSTFSSSFSPRDSNPTLPSQPILGYNAIGFGYVQNGSVFAIGRNGSSHWGDPTGHLALYKFDFTTGTTLPSPIPLVVDTQGYDVHGAGGGVSPSGAIIFFYQRSNPSNNHWIDMYASRYQSGSMTTVKLPLDGDGSFSAYGPLVVLPGGRLLQTAYGWNASRYRVRVFASDDDGFTWRAFGIIDSNFTYRPTETAVAYVSGTEANDSRLIAVAKSDRDIGGALVSYLTQYVSRNGGKTWRKVGNIAVSRTNSTVSPWIAPIGGGRLALVWTDRENLVLSVSIADASKVLYHPSAWLKPTWVYRSRLWGHTGIHRNNFGYPSLISLGNRDSDLYLMFYDSHNGDSGTSMNSASAEVDIFARPLFSPDVRG